MYMCRIVIRLIYEVDFMTYHYTCLIASLEIVQRLAARLRILYAPFAVNCHLD